MKKIILYILLALLLLLAAAYVFYLQPRLPIINGYVSKAACSCTYLANRDLATIEKEDLSFSPVDQSTPALLPEEKAATSSFFGMGHAKSVYKEGFGCILIQGKDDYGISYPDYRPQADSFSFSYVDYNTVKNTKGLNREKLDQAIEDLFKPELETRTVLVIHKDTLVAERYAPGIDAQTPQLGWSMAKSVTSTLIGLMVKNDILTLESDHLFEEWENDERAKITLRDLLQMNSGLEWVEDYGSISDVTKMLYMEEDIVEFLLSKPAEFEPGTAWKYSSGTTNLLMGLIRKTLGDDEAYWLLPHTDLFDKIGMENALIETDESGNFIGSSYCYATAREWANFGLLHLHDGYWGAEQILPEGWVDFISQEAPNSKGTYGGQFWLNLSKADYPSLPASLYYADGFQGQRVMIFPDEDVIIVRLGLSSDYSLDTQFADILKAMGH
ncbi:MAG: serine hydrolase [Saprospiraceae bacterium]|nr:serine hydrolase [Saprospiraceae bacterium]